MPGTGRDSGQQEGETAEGFEWSVDLSSESSRTPWGPSGSLLQNPSGWSGVSQPCFHSLQERAARPSHEAAGPFL